MAEAKTELKKELEKNLTLLQTLRDEVKVHVHLASMELKDQWNKLEPHLDDVEKKAAEVTDEARKALGEAVQKLQKLRASLR
jgi:lipid II:glycine glycyltransferase (peptidoglycan interpeptide bridge formation enzyme)